eukprot:5536671-Alexandrium_andersonii.AAC.1
MLFSSDCGSTGKIAVLPSVIAVPGARSSRGRIANLRAWFASLPSPPLGCGTPESPSDAPELRIALLPNSGLHCSRAPD